MDDSNDRHPDDFAMGAIDDDLDPNVVFFGFVASACVALIVLGIAVLCIGNWLIQGNAP